MLPKEMSFRTGSSWQLMLIAESMSDRNRSVAEEIKEAADMLRIHSVMNMITGGTRCLVRPWVVSQISAWNVAQKCQTRCRYGPVCSRGRRSEDNVHGSLQRLKKDTRAHSARRMS
jgi:hypothetical protein